MRALSLTKAPSPPRPHIASVNADVEAPLIPRGSARQHEDIELNEYLVDRDGKSSPFWAFVNLTNAIVGSAFLGLPFAFALVGLGPGLAMVTFIWILTTYTGRVLLKVSRAYEKTNYEQLADCSESSAGLISLAVFQLGLTGTALVAFVYIAVTNSAYAFAGMTGESLSPSPHHGDGTAESSHTLWAITTVCTIVMMATCLYLSFSYHISSLGSVSLASLVATAVALVCMVWQAAHRDEGIGGDAFWVKEFHFLKWATALGVTSFAFLSQHLLFPVANSLPRAEQFDSLFGAFNVSSVASYCITVAFGIVGYCAGGGNPDYIQYSFLLSYGSKPPAAICIAQLAVALTVVLTYPSEILVARHTIRMLLDSAYAQKLLEAMVTPGDDERQQRRAWVQRVREDVYNPDNPRSHWLHVVLTVSIWAVSVTLGLLPCITALGSSSQALGLIIQIPGPISSAGLAFVMPAIIHLQLGFDRNEERPMRWDCRAWGWQLWVSAAVLVFGVAAMAAAVAGAFYAANHSSQGG